ncbi:MAG: hypothetical protein AAF401_05200 [Pseudomonadota bacterium]
MKALLAALAVLLLPLSVLAEGFAVTDLTTLSDADLSGFEGGEFVAASDDPNRLSILCPSCAGFTAIDIILGQAWDDSEDRLRAGTTDFAKLEELCKNNNPTCTMEPVSVGRAVGWASVYQLGEGVGSTSVLFLDGGMLTIRSLGPSEETTLANAAAAREGIGLRIVGE